MIHAATTTTLLSGVTSGSAIITARGREAVTIYMTGTGTLTAGAIRIEEAPQESYDGEWSLLDDIGDDELTGGKCVAYHLPLGVYGPIKIRITETFAGGTISAFAVVR